MESIKDIADKLPEQMCFKGVWRDYQKDFLEEITFYLADKKLNVVAAPGAGKTTLGLEIIKRLGKPALIMSPAITIKNQWIERLTTCFLPENFDISWISTDIKNIKTITSTTYQAVHTLLKDENSYEIFINELKAKGIKTIVLDESHHLRTEWYQSLTHLCNELKSSANSSSFTIVSLTATPPYDVSETEWKNYKELCGPVDAEIPVPKLVQSGDLCPHQDILWFSDLSEEEKKIIYDFDKGRKEFFDYINYWSDFSYAVKTSAFVSDYENNIELIYENTDFTIAVISYLLSLDDMSVEAKLLANFLCIDCEMIPKFDYDVANTLFNGVLGKFSKYFKSIPLLKSKLKEHNLLISAHSVDFKGETDLKKIYAHSANKLSSIKEITKLEYENLKEDLREVVLLDYIGEKKSLGLNVLSAFKTVLEVEKDIEKPLRPAVLTGSLIVIPASAKEPMYSLLEKYNIKKENVLTTAFEENEKFLRVEVYGETNLVPVLTELFAAGEIKVLIGTQSLLGEGWDAPCVNTLIIASSVGSFMLSNQMRGRALRIDKNNPNKSSNIWHLISLTADKESKDYEVAEKRFKTFEGISFIDNKIQNGVARLGYKDEDLYQKDIASLNAHSLKLAQNRCNLAKKWKQVFEESLYTEKNIKPTVYETVLVPSVKLPEICYYENKSFLYKVFKNYVAQKYLEKSQKETIGIIQAILKTLCDCRVIYTDYEKIKVINKLNYNYQTKRTDINITLTGCQNFERDAFITAVNEFFYLEKTARYIIKKEIFNKNRDLDEVKYYGVPTSLSTKSKNAKRLSVNLFSALGYCEAVFTRNPEGRKELLKALYNKCERQEIRRAKMWF